MEPATARNQDRNLLKENECLRTEVEELRKLVKTLTANQVKGCLKSSTNPSPAKHQKSVHFDPAQPSPTLDPIERPLRLIRPVLKEEKSSESGTENTEDSVPEIKINESVELRQEPIRKSFYQRQIEALRQRLTDLKSKPKEKPTPIVFKSPRAETEKESPTFKKPEVKPKIKIHSHKHKDEVISIKPENLQLGSRKSSLQDELRTDNRKGRIAHRRIETPRALLGYKQKPVENLNKMVTWEKSQGILKQCRVLGKMPLQGKVASVKKECMLLRQKSQLIGATYLSPQRQVQFFNIGAQHKSLLRKK